MKTKYILLLYFFMFSAGEVFSQASPITRKHLRQVIHEGRQDSDYNYFSMVGCNEDSLYFTADTIHFYDNAQFFDQIGICCEFVEWELIGSNLLRQQEPQTCLEPSSVEISTRRYYNYRIKRRGGDVYFQLLDQKNPVSTFRLANIEYIELADQVPCTAITLVRVKGASMKPMLKERQPKKPRKFMRDKPVIMKMESKSPVIPMLLMIEK